MAFEGLQGATALEIPDDELRLLAVIGILSDPEVASGDTKFDAALSIEAADGDRCYQEWLDIALRRFEDRGYQRLSDQTLTLDLSDLESQGLVKRVRELLDVSGLEGITSFRIRQFGAPQTLPTDGAYAEIPTRPLVRAQSLAGAFDSVTAESRPPRLGCFALTPLGRTIAAAVLRVEVSELSRYCF